MSCPGDLSQAAIYAPSLKARYRLTVQRAAQVLVVSVPAFATTNTAVLVNMRTLEAQPIDFSCHGLE